MGDWEPFDLKKTLVVSCYRNLHFILKHPVVRKIINTSLRPENYKLPSLRQKLLCNFLLRFIQKMGDWEPFDLKKTLVLVVIEIYTLF
jgi:hypothetical protein